MEAHNGAVEAHHDALEEAHHGAVVLLWCGSLTLVAITIDFPLQIPHRYHKKINRFKCRYHKYAAVFDDQLMRRIYIM
jgi:hypothetical protein